MIIMIQITSYYIIANKHQVLILALFKIAFKNAHAVNTKTHIIFCLKSKDESRGNESREPNLRNMSKQIMYALAFYFGTFGKKS